MSATIDHLGDCHAVAPNVDPAWTTFYVYRIISVPPERARVILAAMLSSGAACPAGRRRVIEVPRARFVGGPLRPNGGALARASGTLRGTRCWSVPVDLEIVVWSESRTELGIRPRCAYHRLRDTHRYFDAAHAVLDGLVDRLSR